MTATIPSLEARPPDCSLCGRETDHEDDEYICTHCRVGWSSIHYWSPGHRLDDKPQCTAETSPYLDNPALADIRCRCLLNDDHQGRHIGTRIDSPGSAFAYDWPGAAELVDDDHSRMRP